jgi:predicted DsbA family dithiol-disulfide isomerase
MAHGAAMLSSQITLDVIEANEFPQLASAYSVYGVPKTVINDKVEYDGAVPEPMFVKRLLEATESGTK